MIKPIEQFKLHISEIKKMRDLYNFNSQILSPGIDIDGVLRSEIVFIVSALDQYIHQMILDRMIDIILNNRSNPSSFCKLLLGLDSLNNILNIVNTGNMTDIVPFIEQDIKIKLSWRSFQQPDKINEALKMINDKNIWKEVSTLYGMAVNDIKERLSVIVKRRDCIAHEADFDPVNNCQYSISPSITKEAVNFIIDIVFIMDSIIFNYTYNSVIPNELHID